MQGLSERQNRLSLPAAQAEVYQVFIGQTVGATARFTVIIGVMKGTSADGTSDIYRVLI